MDPSLAKALNELAITIVSGIVTVVIPLAYRLVKSYAEAKISHISNTETRAALEFALDRLDATAQTVVTELNQTARPDGRLNAEQAKDALKKAYARISARLPDDVLAVLRKTYGEKLQAVIVGKIEAKVADAKAGA